jgi:hypothetical protein
VGIEETAAVFVGKVFRDLALSLVGLFGFAMILAATGENGCPEDGLD